MKSWKKLKELARFKEKQSPLEPTQDIEEITKGMQDVQHMKTQYEGLHAVSSRVAGRAYGFSEAVQELATFLVNTFGLVEENGEISQVFKEVSKTQYELARLLHLYAFHVSGTLTLPTESLLNELGHIEETKKQYDEKRILYDHMRLRKSKVKNGKLEGQVEQQLQQSKEQFDELAMFLGCRLHSLEQSRPRNLITQAVRHHAAQMHLFRQGVGSLQDIDPFIARVVQDRNLDQTLDYLDSESENPSAVFDSKPKEVEESDPPSSSEQETSPKQLVEEHKSNYRLTQRTGSRSAPISPIRFQEPDAGVNSIQEVMLDGMSKKLPLFKRTNSWLKRKGSRDPGVLHVYKPTTSTNTSQPYSVTEPSSSPAPSSQPESTPFESRLRNSRSGKKLVTFPSFSGGTTQPVSGSRPSRLLVPSSGPLPQPQPLQAPPVDHLYKSGPLNPTPSTVASSLSPPRHKLPPPPLSCTVSGEETKKNTAAQTSKLIPHSAPLGRPHQLHSQHLHQQQHTHQHHSHASPLPPPPLSQSFVKSGNKMLRKNEERVSPLPLNLSTTH